MSVFSIPVTIGIDEETIVQNIEKDIDKKVTQNITEAVEKYLYIQRYGSYTQSSDVLEDTVICEIRKIVKDNEERIIDGAIKDLSNRLSKRKNIAERLNKEIET
jgi:hypothetical protein